MKIFAVGIGAFSDPIELKAIVSDPNNRFPHHAVDPLKRAVIAAALPDIKVFPGNKRFRANFGQRGTLLPLALSGTVFQWICLANVQVRTLT